MTAVTVSGSVTVDGVTYPVSTTFDLTTAGGGLKPRLAGLVDRQGVPPVSHRTAVRCVVITDNWSAIEPTPGVYDWSRLDAQIAAAKAAGSEGVHLRIYGGVQAPQWLITREGGVTLTDGQDGRIYTTLRWWTPGAASAATALDAAAAARYDPDPYVRGTFLWPRGSEFSCEVTIRQAGSLVNRSAYIDAGYSDVQDALDTMAWAGAQAARWPRTHLLCWISSARQRIKPDKTSTLDMAWSQTYGQFLQSTIPGVVIGVNNADAGTYGSQLYTIVDGLGSRRGDQTATRAKMGATTAEQTVALRKTITDAIGARVEWLELPSGYHLLLSATEMAAMDAAMRANGS